MQECRRKQSIAKQALGKLLTEQKSHMKSTVIAGINRPVSKLAASIFPYLYQNADPVAQRNMRMCTAKWVSIILNTIVFSL